MEKAMAQVRSIPYFIIFLCFYIIVFSVIVCNPLVVLPRPFPTPRKLMSFLDIDYIAPVDSFTAQQLIMAVKEGNVNKVIDLMNDDESPVHPDDVDMVRFHFHRILAVIFLEQS